MLGSKWISSKFESARFASDLLLIWFTWSSLLHHAAWWGSKANDLITQSSDDHKTFGTSRASRSQNLCIQLDTRLTEHIVRLNSSSRVWTKVHRPPIDWFNQIESNLPINVFLIAQSLDWLHPTAKINWKYFPLNGQNSRTPQIISRQVSRTKLGEKLIDQYWS